MNLFSITPIGDFSPLLQISVIVLLFVFAAIQQCGEARKTGKMYGTYPPSILLLLVPIYEEILFRGLILGGLLFYVSDIYAIAASSVFFGLWHIKNLRWDGKTRVTHSVLYTGLILGPILGFLTIWSGSIWLAVILHYLNNIWSPISKKLFRKVL